MADIFEPVVRKLFDWGFGNVMIFFLTMAVLYAILKKSKVLGESEAINGTVAVIVSFLIGFWFPIFTGMSLVSSLSSFFAQSMAVLIFIIVGFLIASTFYPDMTGMLMDQFKRRTTIYTMIALSLALFITSGLVSTFWAQMDVPKKPGERPGASEDVYLISAAIILFVVVLIIGSAATKMGD